VRWIATIIARRSKHEPDNNPEGHGGGDSLTSLEQSVESHLMAFAAEKPRLEKRTVHLKDRKDNNGFDD